MPQMTESWQHDRFYAPDLPMTYKDTGLLPFANKPPRELLSWSSVTALSTENAKLVEAVYQLKDTGLSGMQILKTWLERNIQPLAWREYPMYEYRGRNDRSASPRASSSTGAVMPCQGPGSWGPSTTTYRHLKGLVVKGFLPERGVLVWFQRRRQRRFRILRAGTWSFILPSSVAACRSRSIASSRDSLLSMAVNCTTLR